MYIMLKQQNLGTILESEKGITNAHKESSALLSQFTLDLENLISV